MKSHSLLRVITLIAMAVIFSAASAKPAQASPSPREQYRIERLLKYIESSEAQFIRNNNIYLAEKAASHMRWKLLMAGEKIKTANDFVDLIASRSYQTGEVYLVKFDDGDAIPTARWLKDHLRFIDASYAAL
jgi:hypothetical protein